MIFFFNRSSITWVKIKNTDFSLKKQQLGLFAYTSKYLMCVAIKTMFITLVCNSLEALAKSALGMDYAEWMDATTGKILQSTEIFCVLH